MCAYLYLAEFVVFNIAKLKEAVATVKLVCFGGKVLASRRCWGDGGAGGQEAR